MNEYLIFMCSRSLIKNKIYAGWYALILMLREYMRPWVCCFFRVLNFKNNSSILLSINRNGYTHVSIILVLLNISSILPAICPCGLALARYFSQIDEKKKYVVDVSETKCSLALIIIGQCRNFLASAF